MGLKKIHVLVAEGKDGSVHVLGASRQAGDLRDILDSISPAGKLGELELAHAGIAKNIPVAIKKTFDGADPVDAEPEA